MTFGGKANEVAAVAIAALEAELQPLCAAGAGAWRLPAKMIPQAKDVDSEERVNPLAQQMAALASKRGGGGKSRPKPKQNDVEEPVNELAAALAKKKKKTLDGEPEQNDVDEPMNELAAALAKKKKKTLDGEPEQNDVDEPMNELAAALAKKRNKKQRREPAADEERLNAGEGVEGKLLDVASDKADALLAASPRAKAPETEEGAGETAKALDMGGGDASDKDDAALMSD